jgi:hypothetical protein
VSAVGTFVDVLALATFELLSVGTDTFKAALCVDADL